jgi:hypothetical protein
VSGDYTPRDGTAAARIIAYLRDHPTQAYRSADLAEACDVPLTSFGSGVKPLVDAGMVAREGKGVATTYSLGEPTEPPPPGDGKLLIALYDDGDVSIVGGTPLENGGVMYTRGQMEQLLRQLTEPHVKLGEVRA